MPGGEGWFVLNAADARWLGDHFGAYTRFEGDARFLAPDLPVQYRDWLPS